MDWPRVVAPSVVEGHFEDAVPVGRSDIVLFDPFGHPEATVVGLLATAPGVLVFRGDVRSALVPTDVCLLALEARHLDAEDELAVVLVQFHVVVACTTERLGGQVQAPALVVVRLAAISLNLAAQRTRGPGDDGVDATAEGVTCPDCGTENEREYRFCRRYVGELSETVPLPAEGGAPRGRRTF